MIIILFLIVNFIILKGDIIVNETNCRNNRTLESNCKFNVVLKGPILDKIECFLAFKGKNSSAVEFISGKISLMQEVQGQCPQFYLNVISADNKINKLSTICGGYINPINHTFDRFKSAHLWYDNKGLYDNSSNVNITFVLVEKKGKICIEQDRKCSLEPLKIIFIVVFTLYQIILLSIPIIFKICKKKDSDEAPKVDRIPLNDMENHNDRPDTNNENLELRNSLELNSLSSELNDENNSRADVPLETFNISETIHVMIN